MKTAEPKDASLAAVVTAFSRAPVMNPDGTEGIRLHNFKDSAINDAATTGFKSLRDPNVVDSFWDLKKEHGGISNGSAAKGAERLAFHYVIFVHHYDDNLPGIRPGFEGRFRLQRGSRKRHHDLDRGLVHGAQLREESRAH